MGITECVNSDKKSKQFGQILGMKELKAVFIHNNIISKTAF